MGDMIVVRYADDLVFGFEHEADARRFLDAMRARLEAFALSLRLDKTRIIAFGRHASADRSARGLGKASPSSGRYYISHTQPLGIEIQCPQSPRDHTNLRSGTPAGFGAWRT